MRSLSKVNGACAVTGQEHGGQICTRHLHTPFAYAINKTPYVILYWFSVKITLCMYILCGHTEDNNSITTEERDENSSEEEQSSITTEDSSEEEIDPWSTLINDAASKVRDQYDDILQALLMEGHDESEAKQEAFEKILPINKDRLFFCCGQNDSCNYFEWVPKEPYCSAGLPQPEIKQDEKHKEQYPTEDFINDLASLKSCF